MPLGPSARMKSLATARLVDTITVTTVTHVAPTRANLAAGSDTTSVGVMYRASVQTETVSDEAGTNVDRSLRDLSVWVDDVAGTIQTGDRVTFTATRDPSITGTAGTVLSVTRDSLQAVRRLVVRIGNDA